MSTTPSNSVVRAIKQAIYDRLATNPYFANIPGFVIIPKDIFSQIQKGVLPVEQGIAFFIEAFSAGKSDTGLPAPCYEGGRITVSIVEQPTINETLPDCDEVSETAQRLIQAFGEDVLQSAWVSDPSEVETDAFSIRRFYVNIPVDFEKIQMPFLPAVVITPAGAQGGAYPQNVTLALANVVNGAGIWYTLDGSEPAPLNPSAVFYQPLVPLALNDGTDLQLQSGQLLMTGNQIVIAAAGTTLKARPYLGGYLSPMATEASFN